MFVCRILSQLRAKPRIILPARKFSMRIDAISYAYLPCLLICAYRAPKQPIEPFIDYLDDVTREALRLDKQIIIIGDLNCDCLDESAAQTIALKEFLNVYKLTQLIREPTRSTASSESLIDLVITSSPQLFRSTGVLQSGFSDHFPTFLSSDP